MAGVAQWVMDMAGCGGKRNYDGTSARNFGGLTGMEAFEKKMQDAGLNKAAIDAFRHNYESLKAGASGTIAENDIEPVTTLQSMEGLKGSAKKVNLKDVLEKMVVVKLNGGLGTSMGLEKAKSLLIVKDGKTFLDLIIEQVRYLRKVYDAKISFTLMNSFSTSEDTMTYLKSAYPDIVTEVDLELMQNQQLWQSPKVDKKTLNPISWKADSKKEWCPPGHGDLYPSLLGSGMLDRLLEAGKEYMFVSNSDNLGATLDSDILAFFATSELPFLMEVCERTAADKKGGHLAKRSSDGKLILREAAMCRKEDEESFQDISKHKYFNTNNLWVNLKQLKVILDANNGIVPLPLIKNAKSVDPRKPSSPAVLQLETAMGAAIECFEGASAIVVPRNRFSPVKTTADLLALRSDAFRITPDSRVVLASQRAPIVSLDAKHYKLVDQIESFIPHPPSLVGCEALTIKGPVKLLPNTIFHGRVMVVNESPNTKELPASLYDEDVVV